jgi:hypothetical protein
MASKTPVSRGTKVPLKILSIEIQRPLPSFDRWQVTVRFIDQYGQKDRIRAHGTSYLDAVYNIQMRTGNHELVKGLAWSDEDA